jgi:hypothetical protein
MQTTEYKKWLTTQGYQPGTVTAQIHRASRVESCYGDLDKQHLTDQLQGLIEALAYSRADQRNNRPNETKILFAGDVYSNLASYRDAVKRYKRFLEGRAEVEDAEEYANVRDETVQSPQTISLEKDMQAAIRLNISQLEHGLQITDGGRERQVESGLIDITATDSSGSIVVIELKTGVAGKSAVAQVLSYMGCIVDEEEGKDVRGILVASDFDKKARAAVKMVPSLSLVRYSFSFQFTQE